MKRFGIALLALATLLTGSMLLVGAIVEAHRNTVSCQSPGVWLIVNSEADKAESFTTDQGHTGSIPPGGSTTVSYFGTSLTVFGYWPATDTHNTNSGSGDCTEPTTTEVTTSSTTTQPTTTAPSSVPPTTGVSSTTNPASTTSVPTTVVDSTSTTTVPATTSTSPTTTSPSSSTLVSTTLPASSTSSSVSPTSTTSEPPSTSTPPTSSSTPPSVPSSTTPNQPVCEDNPETAIDECGALPASL